MKPNALLTFPVVRRGLALSLFAAAMPAGLWAQTTTRGVETPGREVRVVETVRPLKKSDRDFMEKAAKASMSEVAISRVAAARTSNPDVRRFAQSMIDDHDRANEELAPWPRRAGFRCPPKIRIPTSGRSATRRISIRTIWKR